QSRSAWQWAALQTLFSLPAPVRWQAAGVGQGTAKKSKLASPSSGPLAHLLFGKVMSKASGLIILFARLFGVRLPTLAQGDACAASTFGELGDWHGRHQCFNLETVVGRNSGALFENNISY